MTGTGAGAISGGERGSFFPKLEGGFGELTTPFTLYDMVQTCVGVCFSMTIMKGDVFVVY